MITPEQALAIYHAGPEVVVKVICDLSRQVELLQKQVDLQQKKIEELEHKVAQLSKNSSNSSKPPSSDIVPPPKKQRQPGKRKIGAQPGSPRHLRTPFVPEEIDTFHDYQLELCPECGCKEVTFLDQPPRVIQQMEIKEVLISKEEHRSWAIWCECCRKTHYHPFPDAVAKEGLFKERLSALVTYMKAVHHASYSTIRKFVRDVLGEKVSRGYLRKIVAKASTALDTPYAELLERLPLETVLNVDETGHKENGERFWTWVFRADLYVLFKIDESRSSKVLLDVLGEQFNGILGCDYFSAYRKYMGDFDVAVQFCLAHLIRDIKYLASLPDTATRTYGAELLGAVKAMFKVIHNYDGNNPNEFQSELEKARERIQSVALDNPSRLNSNGKELNREAHNMAKRFQKHGKAYFEFITTPGVDPTNNIAEQAVRFVVIDRRITQGTRSKKGRNSCERLWTVIGTCNLQGRSAYKFILAALHAHFRGETSPSLVPAPS